MSLYHVWLQMVQQLRSFHPDEHSLKFGISAVTLTLNTTNLSNLSRRRSSLCHQTKSGSKRSYQKVTIDYLHRDLDLEDSNESLSLRLIMIHHYTKFGNKRFRRSEVTVRKTLITILKFLFDLCLEHTDPFFSHDTPSHENVPLNQV